MCHFVPFTFFKMRMSNFFQFSRNEQKTLRRRFSHDAPVFRNNVADLSAKTRVDLNWARVSPIRRLYWSYLLKKKLVNFWQISNFVSIMVGELRPHREKAHAADLHCFTRRRAFQKKLGGPYFFMHSKFIGIQLAKNEYHNSIVFSVVQLKLS